MPTMIATEAGQETLLFLPDRNLFQKAFLLPDFEGD